MTQAELVVLGKRRCSKCKEVKALDQFWPSSKDGYYSQCKTCQSAVAHTYNQCHRTENCLRKQRQRLSPKVRAREAAATARWKKAHPAGNGAQVQRARARKVQAPINDFTTAQWLEIQAAYDHRCAYCGKRAKGHLTQEHITPLSKGGSHTASNIVPACRSCNSRKHDGPPLCPVQPFLLTLAPAKVYRPRAS